VSLLSLIARAEVDHEWASDSVPRVALTARPARDVLVITEFARAGLAWGLLWRERLARELG
jgi:hypothetical protein